MTMAELASDVMPDATEDRFLGDRLLIRQPRHGYRAGIDAVLLAASVGGRLGGPQSLLDIGAGVGTVGLCAATRIAGLRVTLLERAPQLCKLAEGNVAANGLSDRVCVAEADLGAPAAALAALGLAQETFDICVANPPFHDDLAGTPARAPLKSASHAMPADALDTWVRFMARMSKPGGRATLIHKAETLPRVLAAFGPRFGKTIVFPVFARSGESAIRVIVSGVKGSRAPLEIRPGIVMHRKGQEFTPEATAILRNGAGLTI